MSSKTRYLIVAATSMEAAPLINDSKISEGFPVDSTFDNCKVLISGIGIADTIFYLTRVLACESFDVVINIGICGSFKKAFPPGSVVHVIEDRFLNQMVETGSGLICWTEAQLAHSVVFKPTWNNHPSIAALPTAHAITSDTVHANPDSIEKIVSLFNPDIESMEGAAVAYVCGKLGLGYCQLRAVSNPVGIRNKDQWQIPKALKNLHNVVMEIVT